MQIGFVGSNLRSQLRKAGMFDARYAYDGGELVRFRP